MKYNIQRLYSTESNVFFTDFTSNKNNILIASGKSVVAERNTVHDQLLPHIYNLSPWKVSDSHKIQIELYHTTGETQPFYTSILKGLNGLSRKQLSNVCSRLILLAEEAYSFRQIDTLNELSQLLMSLPYPPESRVIGHFYFGLSLKRSGKGNLEIARNLFEQVADDGPLYYRFRAMNALGSCARDTGDLESALLMNIECGRFLNCNGIYDANSILVTQKMISAIKGDLGDHKGSLAMLEKLSPLANTAVTHPQIYFDYLNSLAVELGKAGRLDEARAVSNRALKTPFAGVYQEWTETRREIDSMTMEAVLQISNSRTVHSSSREARSPVYHEKEKLPGYGSVESDAFDQKLHSLLNCVERAVTNDEKKKSFESLAQKAFESITFFSYRESNLRTASSEIDLVFQIDRSKAIGIFDKFDHFFIVECKHWKSPVGAAQVRNFAVELQKAKLKFGVIFAWNGISKDAETEIRTAFDSHDLYIIEISGKDLKAINKEKGLLDLLDNKLFNLQFKSKSK